MSDENAERILSNGARARALMTDPLMISVLDAMRQAMVDQFFSTAPEDTKARELLHLMSAAQRRFEQTFHALIQTAEIETAYRLDEVMQQRANDLIDQQVRSR